MKYGNVEFITKYNSVIEAPVNVVLKRHYRGTNITHVQHMGRQATEITADVLVRSKEEYQNLLSLMHTESRLRLSLKATEGYAGVERYYESVVPESMSPQVEAPGIAWVRCTWLAEDPVPYDAATGARLYV